MIMHIHKYNVISQIDERNQKIHLVEDNPTDLFNKLFSSYWPKFEGNLYLPGPGVTVIFDGTSTNDPLY